jgi:thiamine-monophosphate kinase
MQLSSHHSSTASSTSSTPSSAACCAWAAFELRERIDVPYRVVINEAVALAKKFGAADSYKYINGVLDKLAQQLRGPEVSAGRSAAVSDLAAMGARPLAMTVALTLPAADERWLADFRLGLADARDTLALPLVGGDLTRGALTVSIQVFGAVPAAAALRRGGARPGDALYVSGTLGDAAAGLAVLQGRFTPDDEYATALSGRFWRPQPALALGQQLRGLASAAIDVSDGLLADAGHIAEASAVCLRIDSARVPLSTALMRSAAPEQALEWALSGGEDYELCFTLPPDLAPPPGCTRIGSVEPGRGVSCDHATLKTGFRHFGHG